MNKVLARAPFQH